MSRQSFFSLLGMLTLGTSAVLFILHSFPSFNPFWDFSILNLLCFTALTILMFYAGIMASQSTNIYLFNNLIIAFVFGKMLFSALLIFGYTYLKEPSSKLFLLPFLLIYIFYTIFETYFMMKLSAKKKKN